MSVASELAGWVRGLRPAEVPDAVATRAKQHLLDGVGTAVAASRYGAGRPATVVAAALGGPAEATPLTGGDLLSAPAAALATGVLVHALDFDDTHAGGLVHATAVTLPAAFAVGQQTGATGAEILLAAVAGYESVCRLGAGSPHGFHTRGMHATSVCGTVSAALVAGKLLDLPAEVLVDAVGIAGSTSGGLLEFLDTGADTKTLHPGLASMNGIIAARLAAAGASGPDTAIEGRNGLYATLSARPADPSRVTGELGQRWETLAITIKPYPACQLIHVTLDAVAAAVSGDRIEPVDIEQITVWVHPDSAAIVCGDGPEKVQPRTAYDAKFSLPWSVAALLHDGAITVRTYTAASIARPEVAATADRVEVRVAALRDGPAADAPGRAEIRLSDGRILRGEVTGSRGGPNTPLTERELVDKFRANCGDHPAVTELADLLLTLEQQVDIERINRLVTEIAREGDPA